MMNGKRTAQLAAVLAVSIVIGLLVWTELARRSDAESDPIAGSAEFPTLANDKDSSELGGPDGITDIILMGEQGVWTNDDPEVGLIRIRWDVLDPQPDGLFLVERPHATITLENTRIEIRGTSGRIVWPARGLDQDREPESGTLTGDVSVALFEPDAPDDAEPTLRFTTDALNFDTTLGELKAAGDIRVETDRLIYTGTGLSVRYSQAPWRLTGLRVASDNSVTFRDRAANEETRAASRGETRTATSAGAPIELYRLLLREDVRFRSAFAELEAEEILVFARLIDGGLSERAIAEFRSTLSRSPGSGSTRTPVPGDATDGPVRLAWAGPLELRPVRDTPTELADEEVHLTIRSPASNRVQLTDMNSGAVLRCVGMEYGATTRSLAVYGIGGIGVQATIPGAGDALFGRLDLDLTTGEGSIPGPIRVTSDDRDPNASPFRLTALNGASFRFDTAFGPVGAGGMIDPVEIIVRERVEATDGRRTVEGDTARAMFTRRSPESPSVDPQLARLVIEGAARIIDDETDDRIAADLLDVSFDLDHPSDELVPRAATARGSARATQAGRSIDASTLEAFFTQNDAQETELAALNAFEGVRLANDDGTRIACDSIATDERTGVIEIIGSPFRVTTGDRTLSREFTAESARYERERKYLTVFGGGTATQRALDDRTQEFETIGATWTNAMSFDELAGVIELQGDATLTAENAGVERHTARAHLATIRLSPSADGASGFLGATLDALSDESPATLEFKRFAPNTANETQRLANLRAGRIELDAVTSTMTVPGPGLLVVDDRAKDERSDEGDPFAFGTGGSTLFEWDRRLSFDRGEGLALMEGLVRVLHKARGASEVTQLECEQLAALISEPPRGREGAPELVRVDATDAVYAKQGPVEIVADVMTYLGPAARIDASASAGNLVTVRDDRQNRHISAKSVSLDVKSGDWRVTEASPVTSPD